jgi:hypothetical protein
VDGTVTVSNGTVTVSNDTPTSIDENRLIFSESPNTANLGSRIVWKSSGTGFDYASVGFDNGVVGNAGGLRFKTASSVFSDTDTLRATIAGNGDISFYEDTGTTPKFFWDASAESLGIGTSSPWEALSIPFGEGLSFGSAAYPLTISRSPAGELVTTIADGYDSSSARIDFVMRQGAATENTALSITGLGNVGIGTVSPQSNLDVVGSRGIYQRHSSGGRLVFDDSDTADGSTPMSYISNTAGALQFGRANRSASTGLTISSVESMRITSTGNVGIGTVSPTAPLEVSGSAYIRTANTAASQVLRFDRDQATTGDIGQIQFYTKDGAANPTEYGRITGTATTINNGIEKGDLYFSTTLNGTLAERMRITSAGNLGIGTSSPAAKVARS